MPLYPYSADCWEGIVVNLSTKFTHSNQMFVALGCGPSDSRVPIFSLASSNVMRGCDIVVGTVAVRVVAG